MRNRKLRIVALVILLLLAMAYLYNKTLRIKRAEMEYDRKAEEHFDSIK
jgi:uncharacterized ion transporter superfamily protein YfcC